MKKFIKNVGTLPNLNLVYSGCEAIRVDKIKFLGIVLDENLNWREHINMLIKKITPVAKSFFRIGKYLYGNMKRSVYLAHVHSH